MKEYLEYISKQYYLGTPVISDEEYDALIQKYGEDSVGYSSKELKFYHTYQMYSLQKVFEGSDIDPFKGLTKNICCTPKLDGAAVSLKYYDGKFCLGLTRGDGKKGIDVTEKLKFLVPEKIDRMGEVQITGEVVCPSSVPNARNVAAGSLNLKSIEEFKERPLSFIAYDIFPKEKENWSEDLRSLENFNTVLDSNWSEFPQDGKVFRINDNFMFEELGYTAHHPRGAYAFKKQPRGVVTKLLDVLWQVGKSGVVSPVAVLEPVTIGEATVSRATLHNIRYIRELELEIGCNVEVIRSGEIIPRILRKIV